MVYMVKIFKNRMFTSVLLSVVLTFAFVFAVVYASTTISTNITTGGDLTVSGAATITGVATLNGGLTMDSGAFAVTDTSGNTTIGGTLGVTGLTTLVFASTTRVSILRTGYLWIGGMATATGSTGDIYTEGTASSSSLVVGGGSSIARVLFGSCTVNLPSIAASSTGIANCTATGVTTAFKVFVTPCSTSTQIVFTSASSTANNVIQVAAWNIGSPLGTIDPEPSDCWAWMAIR